MDADHEQRTPGPTSNAWEVAKEVRRQGEECHAALEAALSATRALESHLEHIATVSAPGRAQANNLTTDWYTTYQTLRGAHQSSMQAFEACAERELEATP